MRHIHYVHIQPLVQALPSALESSKCELNGHPCSAQPRIEEELVVAELPCVRIPLHDPAAQGVGWITQEYYGNCCVTDYFSVLRW